MKRIVKVLILAGILLFLGLMIMMVGLGFILGDGSRRQNAEESSTATEQDVRYETKTFTADGKDIQKFIIDLTEEDIQILPTTGDEIVIEYVDQVKDPQYVIKSEDGVLKLGQKNTGISGNIIVMPPVLTKDNFQISGNKAQKYQYGDIVVRIPESYTGDYDLSYTSGSVEMKDLHVSGKMRFDLTSGEVSLNNVTGDQNLSVNLTSGELQAHDMSIEGNVSIDYTSADISLESVTIGGDLDLDLTSGSCYANQVTVQGSVGADTTSGDIYMKNLTLGTAINISGTSGTVDVSLTDGMKEYTVRADTVSGACNLPTDYSGGNKKISVSTTSGDINFEFVTQ